MDRILLVSIISYIFVMVSIMVIKPTFMYNINDGNLKQFGTGNGESIVTLPIVGITSCIIIYFIVMLYTLLVQIIDK